MRNRVGARPWTMTYQESPKGKRSRFQIKDAEGRLIARCSHQKTAELIAQAAELAELLEQVTDTAAIWRIILSSEFNHDIKEHKAPGCIDKARNLIMRIRGIRGMLPWQASTSRPG